MIMSVFVALTMATFTLLAKLGLLQPWLVTDRNSLLLSDWLAESTDTWILLLAIMALLIMFYHFQERLIATERQAQAELLHAQALLEEQNANLEQKIQERTGELQDFNLILEQRNAELAIINSVQAGLASKLDIQAIYELVGEKIRETFNAQVVSITTYDHATQLMQSCYYFEDGRIMPGKTFPLFGFRRYVIENHQTLMINEDMAHWIREYDNPVRLGAEPKSAIFIPMMVGDEAIGVISLQNADRENAFRESDRRLLEILANSMSVALENARLFDETQRLLKETGERNAELAIINSVQAGLVAKVDMPAIYDLVGDQMCKIFNDVTVLIDSYDLINEIDDCKYMFEKGKRIYPASQPFSGLARHLIRTRQTVLINKDVYPRAVEFGMEIIPGTQPMKSGVWVPLISANEVKGMISLQNLEYENAFSDSDIRLLQTLANSMNVALENARLFDEAQRLLKETEQRATELVTVNTVSTAIVRELDLSALIDLVGEQIRSIFQTDIVYVALLERDSNLIRFPYQYGQQLEPLPLGQGFTSKIIENGKPLLINEEIERQREQLGTTLVGKRARSYLGVPIFVSGEAIGVISIQSTTQEGIFTEIDQHLLSTIAANVGIAIHNARLFEEIKRQKEYAQETQRRLADIINFLPDATLVIDRGGKVIAWNRAIEEMTNVPVEVMLGKSDYEYAIPFYGERRPILIDLVLLPSEEIEHRYAHIHRTGGVLTGETYIPALKDGPRYLYATASALHDAQGNIVGAIETIRDITERQRVENELREVE